MFKPFTRTKYNVSRTCKKDTGYDSKREAAIAFDLKALERGKWISGLQEQVRFVLQPSFKISGRTIRAIEYIADFVYFDERTQKVIVEDVKGFRTKEYEIKKKMFINNYVIREPFYEFVENRWKATIRYKAT